MMFPMALALPLALLPIVSLLVEVPNAATAGTLNPTTGAATPI